MANGVDVYVQSDLTELGHGIPRLGGPQFIKPEHLSSTISASPGDYLIVIGDRNMKNDTCQCPRVDAADAQSRRSGKLIEMKVDDRIVMLLQNWAQQAGLRSARGAAESDKAVAKMTDEQLHFRLKRLTGVGHIRERLSRLKSAARELSEWRRPRGGGHYGDVGDHTMVAKLTKSQTAIIRVHRELVEAALTLQRLPLIPKGTASGGVPSLGLGQGTSMPATYRPPPIESVLREGGSGAISVALRDRLLSIVRRCASSAEDIGAEFASVAGASSLWSAYMMEYRASQRDRKAAAARARAAGTSAAPPTAPKGGGPAAGASPEASRAAAPAEVAATTVDTPAATGSDAGGEQKDRSDGKTSPAPVVPAPSPTPSLKDGEWVCGICTLVNQPGVTECGACGGARPLEDTEWNLTGTAGKQQRKQHKEREQRERRKKEKAASSAARKPSTASAAANGSRATAGRGVATSAGSASKSVAGGGGRGGRAVAATPPTPPTHRAAAKQPAPAKRVVPPAAKRAVPAAAKRAVATPAKRVAAARPQQPSKPVSGFAAAAAQPAAPGGVRDARNIVSGQSGGLGGRPDGSGYNELFPSLGGSAPPAIPVSGSSSGEASTTTSGPAASQVSTALAWQPPLADASRGSSVGGGSEHGVELGASVGSVHSAAGSTGHPVSVAGGPPAAFGGFSSVSSSVTSGVGHSTGASDVAQPQGFPADPRTAPPASSSSDVGLAHGWGSLTGGPPASVLADDGGLTGAIGGLSGLAGGPGGIPVGVPRGSWGATTDIPMGGSIPGIPGGQRAHSGPVDDSFHLPEFLTGPSASPGRPGVPGQSVQQGLGGAQGDVPPGMWRSTSAPVPRGGVAAPGLPGPAGMGMSSSLSMAAKEFRPTFGASTGAVPGFSAPPGYPDASVHNGNSWGASVSVDAGSSAGSAAASATTSGVPSMPATTSAGPPGFGFGWGADPASAVPTSSAAAPAADGSGWAGAIPTASSGSAAPTSGGFGSALPFATAAGPGDPRGFATFTPMVPSVATSAGDAAPTTESGGALWGNRQQTGTSGGYVPAPQSYQSWQ